MRRLGLAAIVCAMACVLGTAEAADLVLVEKGVSEAPIIVFKGAPPFTRRAADELAEYIEKISGAKPKVIEGEPKPIPPHAIWVGYQPVLEKLFPTLDFDFKHPEEILIAANENHLVIAGRDRWDPDHLVVKGRNFTIEGKQQEYGTANAVYTFLEDYLDVRWLWPGEIGEDILKRATIAFPPFVYRFHPPFRQRVTLFRLSALGDGRGMSHDWTRFQRLQLDSLQTPGGHPHAKWWEKYHEAHPDYFAMQPDGKRSGYPAPMKAKLCLSNPAVWKQWLDNAEEALRADPTLQVIAASENDSHSSGICFCPNCLAWDSMDGQRWAYGWAGGRREHVAMTDRYMRYWNHLARGLRERFPGREVFVKGSAYGPSMPPPVHVVPEKNVIIGYVGHFPTTTEKARAEQKQEWKQWAAKAPAMVYRPNLWFWDGGIYGLPDVAMTKTIEDFRFLAENRCIGIFVDTTLEDWARMGPDYYLMGQLGWDPLQDGRAVLEDYYRRGFGPAAEDVKAYWSAMEEATNAVLSSPNHRTGSANRFRLPPIFAQAYGGGLLDRAGESLRKAAANVADGPEIYQKRVAFVRVGYEFARRLIENIPLMTRARESNGADAEAVRQVAANWAAMEKLCREAGPLALRYDAYHSRMLGRYMGGVQDYYGPPSDAFRKAAEQAGDAPAPPPVPREPARPRTRRPSAAPDTTDFKLEPPEEAGWELIFEDDFAREELGPNWKVIEGNWSVQDGHLRGSGTLVSARGFPGFQRLEFEAVTDVRPVALLGAFVHSGAPGGKCLPHAPRLLLPVRRVHEHPQPTAPSRRGPLGRRGSEDAHHARQGAPHHRRERRGPREIHR